MKTPITYYGGKISMVDIILPMFPKHIHYCEPFTGGGAIFFAKPKSKGESINDIDNRVVNFYRVMKTKEKFYQLQEMIQATPHSESDYKKSKTILKDTTFSDVERAWAFWVQTNMSFGKKIGGGFTFDKKGKTTKGTANKKKDFTDKYLLRLEKTEIFQRDAVELIKLKDDKDTFFYCDPPYINTNQGHYKGYTKENYTDLLNTLSNIKGKFLLSSYPDDILKKYVSKYNWNYEEIKMSLCAGNSKDTNGIRDKKTECLTWNYDLNSQGQLCFFNKEYDEKYLQELIDKATLRLNGIDKDKLLKEIRKYA